MKLSKKMLITCMVISITTVFADQSPDNNNRLSDLDEMFITILGEKLESDIQGLIKDTTEKLKDVSEETIDSFYIPPMKPKEVTIDVPGFLNSKYIELAGGKDEKGRPVISKYDNSIRVLFNEPSNKLIKEAVDLFDDLPSIEEINEMEEFQETVDEAREEFKAVLTDAKNTILINLTDAKNNLLRDIRSYIDNLIYEYQLSKSLGQPVVNYQPVVEQGFWGNVKEFTTGWWSAFKTEAFTSQKDPETGKCKEITDETGKSKEFNITPFRGSETKSAVCRSVIDQLQVTGQNITTNIKKDVTEGAQAIAKEAKEDITKKITGDSEPTKKEEKPKEKEEKPKEKEKDEDTLLLEEAAKSKFDKKAIDAILAKGPNTNVQDKNGNTPLILAFNNDNYELAEYLLTQKVAKIVDPKIKNKQGETAVFALVKSYARLESKVRTDFSKKSDLNDQIEKLVALLKPAINITDNQGKTPLMQAAQDNNDYLVEFLLKAGADITLKDKSGKTVYDYAKGKSQAERALTESKKTSEGLLMLNMSLLAEILESVPDIEDIKELVAQGADVNTKDANGDPLLLLTLSKQPRKENIALELLNLGADPNLGNKSNYTALMEKARTEYFQLGYGDLTIDKALIAKGANVNKTDDAQKTALLYAASAYNLPALKLLLEKGADVKAKNKENENALNSVAKWYGNQKEDFTKQNKLNEFTKLASDIVDALIAAKIDVNNQAKTDKTTALMLFAAAGDAKLVEKLIEAGADMNLKDSKGQIALNYAKPGSPAESILKLYE